MAFAFMDYPSHFSYFPSYIDFSRKIIRRKKIKMETACAEVQAPDEALPTMLTETASYQVIPRISKKSRD